MIAACYVERAPGEGRVGRRRRARRRIPPRCGGLLGPGRVVRRGVKSERLCADWRKRPRIGRKLEIRGERLCALWVSPRRTAENRQIRSAQPPCGTRGRVAVGRGATAERRVSHSRGKRSASAGPVGWRTNPKMLTRQEFWSGLWFRAGCGLADAPLVRRESAREEAAPSEGGDACVAAGEAVPRSYTVRGRRARQPGCGASRRRGVAATHASPARGGASRPSLRG